MANLAPVVDEFCLTAEEMVPTTATAVSTTAPAVTTMFPVETLEKKKRRLIAFEESFINDDAKVAVFEEWYREKKFDTAVDLFQAWLVLKNAAAGTPMQALHHVLGSKIPKNVTKTKTNRKAEKPDGIKRHDPLSEEWMSIFKKKEDERAEKSRKEEEKKAKQAEKSKEAAEKKSKRKRRGI